MVTDYAAESAAANAVGTNLMSGHTHQISNRARVLNRVALVGSAAADDAAVEVKIGNEVITRLGNTRTGTALLDEVDWKGVDYVIEASEPFNAIIVDAGATNVLRFHFDFDYLE